MNEQELSLKRIKYVIFSQRELVPGQGTKEVSINNADFQLIQTLCEKHSCHRAHEGRGYISKRFVS